MHARLASALADRYRLLQELGAVGMATAYLAEDLKHQLSVPLTLLKSELAAVLGAERFVETQLDVDDAVRISREVADALDDPHRQGGIHRDIKPENILLYDGRATVVNLRYCHFRELFFDADDGRRLRWPDPDDATARTLDVAYWFRRTLGAHALMYQELNSPSARPSS